MIVAVYLNGLTASPWLLLSRNKSWCVCGHICMTKGRWKVHSKIEYVKKKVRKFLLPKCLSLNARCVTFDSILWYESTLQINEYICLYNPHGRRYQMIMVALITCLAESNFAALYKYFSLISRFHLEKDIPAVMSGLKSWNFEQIHNLRYCRNMVA